MSEHQWEDTGGVVALDYIGGLTPKDIRRQRYCKVCGQGDVVPVEDGYTGGYCVGVYSRWDGVKTCEDVILERHREETLARQRQADREASIAALRPRAAAFIAELNALSLKHGLHFSDTDDDPSICEGALHHELRDQGLGVNMKYVTP